MTAHEPRMLTLEERALAQRLAQLGPHGEPSPTLDTRILAAAHAAATGITQPGARAASRRRWPLAFGVAASLALALGLAWQLRPLPDAIPAYRSEADSALQAVPSESMPALPEVAAPMETPPTDMARSESAGTTSVADAQREAAAAPAQHPAPAVAAVESTQAVAPAATAEPPLVFDAPTPAAATPVVAPASSSVRSAKASSAQPAMETAATTTANPASVQTPQAFTGNVAPTAIQRADVQASPPQRTAIGRAATSATTPVVRNAAAALPPPASDANAAFPASDEPLDAVPPATVATPQVRDAWLARIRELANAGRRDEARASLHEFRHRYPDYPLPDDLRALSQ